MDPFTQFAMTASAMAVEDAGLGSFSFDKNRAGVIIGSGIGGSQSIEDGNARIREKGPKGLNPFLVSMLLINMAACMVSIRYSLKGPLSALSVACSTGSNAIGDAFRIIQRGDADIMLAGSSEACITPLAYGGFCATRSMTSSDCAETASRPFDKNRDGFVMGEGAGIVDLENLQHALKRDARIYASIGGYGNTADAYHFTAPEPEGDGMVRVMQAALKDAHLEAAVTTCVTSRLINSGQSCIAAKRFIVVESIKEKFETMYVEQMRSKKMGDPLEEDTDVGPQARHDLRDELHVHPRVTRGHQAVAEGPPGR